ncbi:MAG: SpoIIE family protein phosphatase [Planctomycetes bacterium]|nr:SpoIIE family protein phosphatase [Planctomycetota bacterium]
MAFWKRKQKDEVPQAPVASGAAEASSGADRHATQFLTGDAERDQRSVEGLLEEIARISERVARVSGSDDLEELLTYIVDASIRRTGAERGFLVFSRSDGELATEVGRKRGGSDLDSDERYSTSAVRMVLETGQPLKDMFNSAAEAMDLGASVFDLKLRALMCAPLDAAGSKRDGLRGVLYVDSKAATREFSMQDLSYFTALSQQIAVALESARLHLDSLMKVRLEQSLELASEVQRGFMPRIPEGVEGYDLFGWYQSAERTSGDFYDFVKTRGGNMGVVIGDVTGHGIGPALVTASAQASLRSLLRVVDDPAVAIGMLNEDLGERSEDGTFVTLFLAVLGKNGEVRSLNAGHPAAFVWRAASGDVERIAGHGPALGMMDGFPYEESEVVKLEVGDVMLLITDGLAEARHEDAEDDLYGEERLAETLRTAGPKAANARELTEAIVESVLAFAGGRREDDMTVVCVRRVAS